MDELFTWYWWISVVVVGLMINLASAYAKPLLDDFFRFISVRHLRNDIEEAKRELTKLEKYVGSQTAMLAMGFSGLFALVGISSLLGILLSVIPHSDDAYLVLSVLIFVFVTVIAIYMASLFYKIREYPASRAALEKRIAELEKQLPS